MPTPLIIIIAAFFIGAIAYYMSDEGEIDGAIQVGIAAAVYVGIGVGVVCWISSLIG